MDAEDLIPYRVAEYYLGNAPSLVWILVADGLGFLVGVRFYVETMPAVPTFLWPLYGDSPTAIALFALSLATLLPHLGNKVADAPVNGPLAYLHTLAFASLVKYGLWTFVALNRHPDLYIGFGLDSLYSYWGILITHLAFVGAALLIPVYGATSKRALGVTAVFLFANDLFDYGVGYHPPLRYDPGLVLAAATTALSVVALGLAWWLLPPLSKAAARREPGGANKDETSG
jgi:uncharacterized membrane protein YpjA